MITSEESRRSALAFENALLEVAKATDSAGRFIILLPPETMSDSPHQKMPPSSEHIIRTMRKVGAEYFANPYLHYLPPGAGNEAFLRNLGLLANAAAAALAYERIQRGPVGW